MVRWPGTVRARLFARNAVVLGAVLASACGSEGKKPQTELLLVADTDIAELERITFEVSAKGRDTESQGGAVRDDGEPLSVGVVRENGPMGPITVVARGFVADQEVISRSSVVWFAAGKTLVVPLHLLSSCLDVSCLADQTCTESGCAPLTLDIDDLTEWTGSTPSLPWPGARADAASDEHDAGVPSVVRDAGLDARVAPDADAPTDDAGEDAEVEPPDADAVDADAVPDAEPPPIDSGSDGGNDAGDAGPGDAGPVLTTCGAAGSFDLQNDPKHCGSCSNVCSEALFSYYYYTPSCSQGTCGFRCAALHANCDDLTLINGCETPVGADRYNCGACNHVCGTGQSCVSGVCTP